MTEVSSVNTQSVIDSLSKNSGKSTATGDSGNIGNQQTFMKLMIAQLNNQDPLSPQDNGEFVAQLAQFSSLEGIQNLNTQLTGLNTNVSTGLGVQNSTLSGINTLNASMSGMTSNYMSNQALQASSLVGHAVTVAADSTQFLQGDIVNGSMQMSQYSPNVNLHVFDTVSGKRIDSVPLGALRAGENVFRWNGQGLELNGEMVPFNSELSGMAASGKYKFVAEASINGQATAVPMALSANVNSVTVGANGQLVLNLAGLGAVPLSAVKQFG
jgi:flagellar basal-body rod modification protein FlgD